MTRFVEEPSWSDTKAPLESRRCLGVSKGADAYTLPPAKVTVDREAN